jgi:isopenicillin N synthase-like dioxygenase
MPDGLPIIDLRSSGEGDEASLTRIAAGVGAACRDVGFFYVVNHGVDQELIAKAFAQSRGFFALPVADKRKLAIETIGGNRGYSGLLHEALDPTRGPDMKEAVNVGFELAADDPELLAGAPFRSLNAWLGVPGFRGTLLSYYDACAALGARLHRAFASDLGLRTDFFDNKFDRQMATLRLLHYPASPRAAAAPTGAGEHTDYGNLTLLATDDVGGLEVRWPMDRSAGRPRRLHRQHWRLSDALDKRRLCFDAASGRQSECERTVFNRPFSTIRIRTRWSKRFRVAWGRGRSCVIRRSWRPTI